MAEDALAVVTLRNTFYRDNYRRVVMGLLLMIVINLGLGGVIFYMVSHKQPPKYFATTADGRILPLYPLDAPMVSKAKLLSWANQAAISVYNFSFVHWQQQLQAASNYFTAAGWKNFEAALKSTGDLQTVLTKKLVVSAVATGAPVILNQGVVGGRYAWKVSIPLLVTYQSQK